MGENPPLHSHWLRQAPVAYNLQKCSHHFSFKENLNCLSFYCLYSSKIKMHHFHLEMMEIVEFKKGESHLPHSFQSDPTPCADSSCHGHRQMWGNRVAYPASLSGDLLFIISLNLRSSLEIHFKSDLRNNKLGEIKNPQTDRAREPYCHCKSSCSLSSRFHGLTTALGLRRVPWHLGEDARTISSLFF